MYCRKCRGVKAEKRPLYTLLNCELALKLTCGRLAELLRLDGEQVENVIEACRREAAAAQQPDPTALSQLKAKEQRLKRSIDFNRRNPGETDEDQADTARLLKQLRTDWNEVLVKIAKLEGAPDRKIEVPTAEEVRQMLDKFDSILSSAATGRIGEDAELAREIIDLLTGGRIELEQMGERKPQKGWLRGHFKVSLLSVLVDRLIGVSATVADEEIEVMIDYRPPVPYEAEAEQALGLYREGVMEKEIAKELGCSRSKVTKLLDHAFEKRGEKRPDGRKRRGELAKKQAETPVYQQIAEEAARLAENGCRKLAIGRRFNVSDATVAKAIAFWYQSQGRPVPTAADFRKMMLRRARTMYRGGMLITDIAAELGYGARGMELALKKYMAELGETMADGRARRGNAKSGEHACGHALRDHNGTGRDS